LPDLLQGRNDQLHPRSRIDQGRLVLLIIEDFGLVGVEDLVGKFYDLARLRPLNG
jgi:hypothetical protein